MRTLKVIWDFRGPEAVKTAEHHVIHLKEYAAIKELPFIEIATETKNEHHTLAFIAIEEQYTAGLRQDLKPHRATLYSKA